MTSLALTELAELRRKGKPRGITSVCSAHPLVLRAALQHGRDTGATVLIEATCNQVNHHGGYTGMKPQDFASLVVDMAQQEGCPANQIILGGDHLGPNPWRRLPADDAMEQASEMVAAYVTAGFRKLHLDTSMGCADEPVALGDDMTAQRAARLVETAEQTAGALKQAPPLYIIGTEVPPPGGADHTLQKVPPTEPESARKTIEVHRKAFAELGLVEALPRVIGLVVQPGVEFGNTNVVTYQADLARSLTRVLDDYPDLVFEAHSTDYQGTGPLTELVRDGFSILKVGPELTFALREALYALDLIASDLIPDYGNRPLYETMDKLMLQSPDYWTGHYHGTASDLHFMRHYSLSDRIRYYWTSPEAQTAVTRLFNALKGQSVPRPLFWQHLPRAAAYAEYTLDPEDILVQCVRASLENYQEACDEREKQ